MKRLLLLLPLTLFCHLLSAQCTSILFVNLDSGNISKLIRWYYGGPTYLNLPNLINIDTVHYHRNQWQIGRPQKAIFDSAYSYPNAIVTDTLLPCIPKDTSVFITELPMLGMAKPCIISFYYKLNIDSGDIALIEFSNNDGHTWHNVLQDSLGFDFQNGIPNLAVSTVGWDSIGIFNGGYLNYPDSPLLRFTFISDSNTSPRAGWMIDNLKFGYFTEGVTQVNNNYFLNVYPNPASTELTITSSQRITDVTVTRLVGQMLYHKPCNSTEVTVDVSNLPVGVYLVRINGIEFRRFVKE